ncbi:META domain-containing protein [uncultured Methanospirillum sp.]|uniref:META domain-containing protein n=1 Tax=uncultured Methanospirillum sp. TaxID=262503 RepID=UPI0029C69581|nr:META domain-containing protein [uncultured Methanospirillum sp.]
MGRIKFLLVSLVLVLAVSCLFSACLSTDQSGKTPVQSVITTHTTQVADNRSESGSNGSTRKPDVIETTVPIISGTGVILFQDLEGGAYTIRDDRGHHYQPLSLPPDLKVNGTIVSYQLQPVHDMVSVIMAGDPVHIISIEPVAGSRISNRSEPLISFEKAAGTTGSYEELKIFADKHGEVTKWTQIQFINLSDSEMDNLTSLCTRANFTTVKPQALPVNPSPNAVIYTIRYQNQTIKASNGSIPVLLEPVIEHLENILGKYTISPITANKTLENTAWYLTSYLRKDGIPVRLTNNTKISALFGKDNEVTGVSGCNPYTGHYNLSGTSLSFSKIVGTRMACQDQATMETESVYLKLLEQVAMVSGHDKNLTMTDRNNTTLLTYIQMKV